MVRRDSNDAPKPDACIIIVRENWAHVPILILEFIFLGLARFGAATDPGCRATLVDDRPVVILLDKSGSMERVRLLRAILRAYASEMTSARSKTSMRVDY
jgi:hypothetical protein